jgi:DNA-binding transcriptional LysR family regulator
MSSISDGADKLDARRGDHNLRKFDGNPRQSFSVDNVDIRLMRIFMRVVEAGGLSAAQSDLNLSLSTISEKITALEQRLGVSLCKRGRRGFVLTEHGRLVFEECQRLFGSLDQFGRKVSGLRSNLAGTLTVGMVDNIISDPRSALADAVGKLVDAAPSVSLVLETRPPGELLRDIVARKLDLGIGSFPRMALGLSYIDLYDELQNFYCGRGHPLFDVPDDEITIDVVRVHRIIGRSYWAARDIKIFAISNPHATVSNMEAEAFLILSGNYLGYLPDHYADSFQKAGRIRPIRPDLFSYKAKFQIATSEDWMDRPLTKTFVQILEGCSLKV